VKNNAKSTENRLVTPKGTCASSDCTEKEKQHPI